MYLIRAAVVDGRLTDVRLRGETIVELGALRPAPGETVINAAKGALLPGLHDHHLHLLSLAAAARSVWCGPPQVTNTVELARALTTAQGRWIRGIGYHESVAGLPDRHLLDTLMSDRPLRLQHRSGALWVLNSAALTELDLTKEAPDGRLWRNDALLRERLAPTDPPDLTAVGHRLATYGITGVTDATPDLSQDTIHLLTNAALPQNLHLMGTPTGPAPLKILPAEPPDLTHLRDRIGRTRATGRPVAVHAVTREGLVVVAAVLADVGTLPGDRIEHAAIVGKDMIPMLADLNVTVVTQPGLLAERQGEYRRDVPEAEHDDLYRYASLLRAGIRVAPSSDAPFADADPWRTIAAATTREPGQAERVTPRQALDGFLAPLNDPGGPPRRVEPGAPADLCLLSVPLTEALAAPNKSLVAATFHRGRRTK